jgi:hypothetical protein
VTFFWNDDGTVLEIESKNFLEYASGENKSVVAKSYTFSFSNTAKDSSGNALEGFSSGFSTFRKINEKLFGEAQLDGEVTEGGEYFPNANTIRVGDNTKDEAIRGFLSFNLTDIPQGAVGVDAVLLVFQEDFVSNPYLAFNSNPCVPAPFTPVCATNFRMLAESVTYGDSLAAAFDTPSRGTFFLFGTISSPPYDTPERGGFMLAYVSAAFNDDLANRTLRGNRSQYRLMFPVKTNNDGKLNYVNITPSEGRVAGRPFLSVTYLAP